MISVFYYIFSNTDIEPDNIIKEIKQISDKGGEIAMTTAVRLRQQGMQQGLQKGILEGKKEAIIKLYTKRRFTIKEIAELFDLDYKFVENTIKDSKKIK